MEEDSFEYITQYSDTASRINCLALNQCYSQLGCGTQLGFRIYSLPEFRLLSQREKDNFPLQSSIDHLALLQESMIVALNPAGNNPRYNKDMVYVWHDKQQVIIRQVQAYHTMTSLQFYLDYLFLAGDQRLSVYKISEKQKLQLKIHGVTLYSIGLHAHRLVLAYWSHEKNILVKDIVYGRSLQVREKSSQQNEGCQLLRMARQNDWLIKVSSSGRYVWIYQIETSKILFTLYRGYHNYSILDMSLSPDHSALALITTKGSLHIFALVPPKEKGLMQILSTDYTTSYVKRAVSLEMKTTETILSSEETTSCSAILLVMMSSSQLLVVGDNFQFERLKVVADGEQGYMVRCLRKGQWFDNYQLIRSHVQSLQRVIRTSLRDRLAF